MSNNVKANSSSKPKTQSTEKETSAKETKPIFEFSQEEFEMLNKTNEEMNIDDVEFSDLKNLPTEPPMPSDKELDDIINDPKYNATVLNTNETPPILNTLGPNDQLGKITDEDVLKIQTNNLKHKKNLIVLLASKDHINLDIKIGMRDGKSIFIQKPFYYNAIDKKEEFKLKMRSARLSQISHKYTIIVNRQDRAWTDQEGDFLSLAPAMIEIASYQLAEDDAKLRLGMSAEDFARVDVVQFQLAKQVIDWRTANPSFSNLGR